MFTLNSESLNPTFCYSQSKQIVSSALFLQQVAGASEYLKSKGQRLALCFEDSYLFSVALFAALSQGKKVIILPNNKSGNVAAHSHEFDEVLTEEDFLKVQPRSECPELQISSEAQITFFTSGSSGTSKKVEKKFKNLYSEVLILEKTFSKKIAESVVLATVTHQHVYGFLFKVLWPICMKRTWVSSTLEYPEQIVSLAKNGGAFALISTPAFLKRYFAPAADILNCKMVFSSGGVLDFTAAQLTLKTFAVAPTEVYGSTESGGIAYCERTSEDQGWTPFEGVSFSIDEDDQLRVQSPYFDQAELQIGDRAERQGTSFRLLGRADDVVKIEEKRISLSHLNLKVSELSWISDSVVIALETKGRQQTACLAVLTESGRQMLLTKGMVFLCNEIRNALLAEFEAVVLPKKFRFVESLPYNAQAKLVRSELLRYFND